MGFFNLFCCKADEGDPAIAALAAALTDHLCAIGLQVEAKRYGGFHEMRASTSAKFITEPGNRSASGIMLLLAPAFDPPTLVFQEINSIERGMGRRMIAAVLSTLRAAPGALTRIKVNDLSPFQNDGRRWWENVADEYPDFDWLITHHPDDMLSSAQPATSTPDASDFDRKREKITEFAWQFGYDPEKISLSRETKTFQYLGQCFTSEGETLPGGEIIIYYDPKMSIARLGCCLAHEIQHARYFVVRDAFEKEAEDGPLHRRFEKFTPALLAARRGVSDYSNEHWDAWNGAAQPRLFSDELAEGGSEPINETIAEIAKAYFNWGSEVALDPLWKELHAAINEEYARIERQS